MGTPSSPEPDKTIRVKADVHERLGRIVDNMGSGATMSDAIALLMSPHTVRVNLDTEQYARWVAMAKANGVDVATFAMMRVEAAIQYGADPGALRRIHDHVHALVRAAGLVDGSVDGSSDTDAAVITDLHTASSAWSRGRK